MNKSSDFLYLFSKDRKQVKEMPNKNTEEIRPLQKPHFPQPGSTVGPGGQYFCIGRLGAGTFCEISRCIDLSFFHKRENEALDPNLRIVAAKVELSTFTNSGVLDGEATILKHLSNNMPYAMIPKFFDYVKTHVKGNDKSQTEISTIIMEFLAGEDMNKLRDRNAQYIAAERKDAQNLQKYRRLSIKDSVYLCKDVFLRLLEEMHNCGCIHRDVKPSNCVRTGPNENDRDFKLVDFGLSKSFVVPKESSFAGDTKWDGPWDLPRIVDGGTDAQSDSNKIGYIRKERNGADFRGTSMYASLRVHQGRDYCRRDDLWGLLYVFCDLVSGGLPWMGYAANRDRSMCQLIKEYVHGERLEVDVTTPASDQMKDENHILSTGKKNHPDHIGELLKGADYHLHKHRQDCILAKAKASGNEIPNVESLPKLPEPLKMSSDEAKCNALRMAFDHLSQLSFSDKPDYDLIRNCFDIFLRSENVGVENEYDPPEIHWKQPAPKTKTSSGKDKSSKKRRHSISFLDALDVDPLSRTIFAEAEAIIEKENSREGNKGNDLNVDIARLPLALQFQIAQVEYNALHPDTIPIHLAFRDWMNLATALVYDAWDAGAYEKGNNRSNEDGYVRELYLQLLTQCLEASKPFKYFSSRECFYYGNGEIDGDGKPIQKRRKILMDECKTSKGDGTAKSTLLTFSKVMCSLRALAEMERERPFAPPLFG